jgi:hypothetical protein
MSESAPRGIANLATKRKPDPKRMLARNRQDDETPVDEPVVVETSAAAEAAAPTAASAIEPKAPHSTTRTTAEEDAGYLALERKETRLREGQIGELTAHARRLNKAKTAPAPRITENTLIRVAIDLLLSRVDGLQGNTEEDLRRSLGI